MAAEDIQNEERVGLRRKPTGPPRLLLERTRTRSAGEETKRTGNSQDGLSRSSEAPARSEGELTSRGRQHVGGQRRRCKWWRRFSSAVVCFRGHEEGGGSPPERKHDGVPLEGGEEGRETDLKKMRNIWRRFAQKHPDPSREDESSQSVREKLRKFFTRSAERTSVPPGKMEVMKVEEDPGAPELSKLPDGHPDVQMFLHRDSAENPEPPTENPEEASVIQTAHLDQVLVRDVSSEEDEVLFDSELIVDLHSQPASQLSLEEKVVPASRSNPPSANGPSIRIQLYPPDDVPREEAEDGCWGGVSSSENHLLHLLCYDQREQQLLQAARSLVRAAIAGALEQLTRESDADATQQEGCR